MPPLENMISFRTLIIDAINVREAILFPKNPLFEVSQSVMDQEVTRKEQDFLRYLLIEFESLFPESKNSEI
jgi:hypothetical protein